MGTAVRPTKACAKRSYASSSRNLFFISSQAHSPQRTTQRLTHYQERTRVPIITNKTQPAIRRRPYNAKQKSNQVGKPYRKCQLKSHSTRRCTEHCLNTGQHLLGCGCARSLVLERCTADYIKLALIGLMRR